MSRIVFVDSAYLIALAAADDQHHNEALVLAEKFDRDDVRFAITRAVFLEIGSALSKRHLRRAACEIFEEMESDARVKLIELEPPVLEAAQALFCGRADKEWSLTDCISFVVMKEWRISDALTTDVHFEQAGFRALLRKI
jgi:predicted nucleic acid-binding protein